MKHDRKKLAALLPSCQIPSAPQDVDSDQDHQEEEHEPASLAERRATPGRSLIPVLHSLPTESFAIVEPAPPGCASTLDSTRRTKLMRRDGRLPHATDAPPGFGVSLPPAPPGDMLLEAPERARRHRPVQDGARKPSAVSRGDRSAHAPPSAARESAGSSRAVRRSRSAGGRAIRRGPARGGRARRT